MLTHRCQLLNCKGGCIHSFTHSIDKPHCSSCLHAMIISVPGLRDRLYCSLGHHCMLKALANVWTNSMNSECCGWLTVQHSVFLASLGLGPPTVIAGLRGWMDVWVRVSTQWKRGFSAGQLSALWQNSDLHSEPSQWITFIYEAHFASTDGCEVCYLTCSHFQFCSHRTKGLL